MPRVFLLLAMCTLAVALPRNTRSVETETVDSVAQELDSTTTKKPESKVIIIESSADLVARLTQAGHKLVVIYSMTSWCGHSRRIRPTVEDIAANTENLVVLMVDVDTVQNTPGVAWKYGVTGVGAVPTFFFVKNGRELEHYAGSGSKKLRRVVSKHMGSSYTTTSTGPPDSSEEN